MWRRTPTEPNRRAVLTGRLASTTPLDNAEIAGILVQMRPERLDEVEVAIRAIPGTEVHSRDAAGKLVVVIEAATVGAIGARLHEIAQLPGVLNANLAFHATDAA